MKGIGIILASNPGYSETFLMNKISYLKKAGLQVIVFADRDRNARIKDCKTVIAHQVAETAWIRFLKIGWVILYTTLVHPAACTRFFLSELKDGRSWLVACKNLYRSCHVFGYSLAWIHFEFATLALGRENLCRAVKARMAVSVRGFDISLYPLSHPNCYILLWKRVDKLHSISDDLYLEALRQGFPAEKPWVKITPAINTDIVKPKMNLGLIGNPVKVVSVGRLEWKKGFEYAIRAICLLKQVGISIEYRIVGEGSERESLAYSIVQQQLQHEVILKGRLSHSETLQVMHEADIYLQPSVQEGFCNALIEAQATGLLCIATNAEGLSENVINEESGWIVPKVNPHALAKKIQEVIELPAAVRKGIAENAIHRVNSNFRLESQVRQFNDFYAN